MVSPKLHQHLITSSKIPGVKSGLFNIGVKKEVNLDLPSSLQTDLHAFRVLTIIGLSYISFMFWKLLTRRRALKGNCEKEDSISNQVEEESFPTHSAMYLRWELNYIFDVWFVTIGQYLAKIKLFENLESKSVKKSKYWEKHL